MARALGKEGEIGISSEIPQEPKERMGVKAISAGGPNPGASMQGEFQVADWVVSPKLNSFRKNGHVVHLEPKVMQVLVCLAEERDVVSKEKLMRRVWPDTFVTDDVLTRSISELRKGFEDNAKDPQYIQTIPKGGYRLIAPILEVQPPKTLPVVPPTPSVEVEKKRTWRKFPLLFVCALGLLAMVYAVGRYNSRRTTQGRAMLAVLPFQNLSNDPDQQYFADGLTAEMISQIGRLPSDRLGVIDWNSMARYRGSTRDESKIAWELGANYVLEGTVRRSGNQVRITAELLETGKRGHIWSNSYDGSLEDVLKLQNQVAREIASEIRVQLTPQDEMRLANSAPVNGQGYEDYLKAKFGSDNSMPNTTMKMGHLQEAIRLNPGYAPAYVALAASYRNDASRGFADPQASYAAARVAIEKALAIDPSSAEVHRELAWIEWRYDWDFSAADKEIRKAEELDPNNGETPATYALYLKSMTRFNEAVHELTKSLELDPMNSYACANAGSQLALMHDFTNAEGQFEKALRIDPREPYVYERLGPVFLLEGKNQQAIDALEHARDYSRGQQDKIAWLGYAYAVSGRTDDARKILEELRDLASHGEYVSPLHVALVYAGLGDKEEALGYLEKAYQNRDEYLVYLNVYPELESLRSDSRFQDLQHRVRFPASF